MQEFLNVTKALANENRVRVLLFLRGGEPCVCAIIEMLGLAPSTASKHLAILQQAGLVESRKVGRWIYYRLADEATSPCARQAAGVDTRVPGEGPAGPRGPAAGQDRPQNEPGRTLPALSLLRHCYGRPGGKRGPDRHPHDQAVLLLWHASSQQ